MCQFFLFNENALYGVSTQIQIWRRIWQGGKKVLKKTAKCPPARRTSKAPVALRSSRKVSYTEKLKYANFSPFFPKRRLSIGICANADGISFLQSWAKLNVKFHFQPSVHLKGELSRAACFLTQRPLDACDCAEDTEWKSEKQQRQTRQCPLDAGVSLTNYGLIAHRYWC
ncbi:hypothetical protein M514_02068 [Trichuris suis]|uniref:Uncharacterized protein n=1 Tax=Trichuris suis TaxID=68888 RepID=A0A085MIY7_9BILA|nr:hypothetical protein M513_02068 [Trichuris suis]KFD63373.1 hypothetical protein M514_02068 [Trichuris suis]